MFNNLNIIRTIKYIKKYSYEKKNFNKSYLIQRKSFYDINYFFVC